MHKYFCTFAASFQYIRLCHKWLCWAVRWFASTLPRKQSSIPLHKAAVGPRDIVVVPAASLSTSYPTAMNYWQLQAKVCTTPPRKDVVGRRDTQVAPVVNFNAWWTEAENYLPKHPRASTIVPPAADRGQRGDKRWKLPTYLNVVAAHSCASG